jgi:hypothetical protein
MVAGLIAASAACGATPDRARDPASTATTITASRTPTASTSLEPTEFQTVPSSAPTVGPSPKFTPPPVPPKPTGVSFEETRVGDEAPSTRITQTVRWAEPRTEGVEIRVYGVTQCIAKPAEPSPDTAGPCLVVHTPLPPSVRTLLASAAASDGVVSWTWTGTFDCEVGLAYDPGGPAYEAVVVAAYSSSGHSIFAIAEAGSWWQPGPNDIVC